MLLAKLVDIIGVANHNSDKEFISMNFRIIKYIKSVHITS